MSSILPFKKNLTDLVRGIRNNKNNEQAFISQCIQEIKQELRSDSTKDKANAIQKLSYLQMRGYDMSWAAFNVIEVLSLGKFSMKRIAYQAAALSFSESTDVAVLSTNLIRKDLLSKSQYEAGIALSALASFCTPNLARDLAPDIVTMLTSSRPYIRKKAVLVLYRIFLKFPEALRPAFNRLKEKLEDSDPSVMCAAVTVICELARKNPKNYIPLAPTLFKILTTSQNNWMLIKIIKLFASLCPHEPRLAKKLVEPLTTIINNTQAMSLLYEAIQACIVGLNQYEAVIKLCLSKLRMFVEHPDQNLKYLGLLAMQGIMPYYPKAVAEHRDLILGCLDDEDVSVRVRALDLIISMVTKKNLPAITNKLMEHLQTAEGTYRDELLDKIVFMCSQQLYKFITDFEWYIGVLIDLTRVQSKRGKLIRDQLIDVCVRVSVVRPYAVEAMINFLRDTRLLADSPEAGGMCEALYAAAWIVGEYSDAQDDLLGAIEGLLHPRVTSLPAHIQSVYVQALLKIFAKLAAARIPTEESDPAAVEKANSRFKKCLEIIEFKLPMFTQSQHLEVQERSCFLTALIDIYKDSHANGKDLSSELVSLFDEPLNPVKPGAADQVPVPEGLDLDQWINDPPPKPEPLPTSNYEMGSSAGFGEFGPTGFTSGYVPGNYQPASLEEIERRKMEHRNRMQGNMFYLGGETQAPISPTASRNTPPPTLDPTDIGLPSDFSLSGKSSRSSRHSGRHSSRHHRDRRAKEYVVSADEEVPEGYQPQVAAKKQQDANVDPLSQIDLSDITPAEQLQHQRHRSAAADNSYLNAPRKQSSAHYLTDQKPSSANNAPLSPATPSGGEKESRSGREHSSRHRSEKDKDKHRHHSSRSDRDHHRSSHRSSHSSRKERLRTLYSDSNLDVAYSFACSQQDPNSAVATLYFENRGATNIFSIELDIQDGPTARWVRPADLPKVGPVPLSLTIPAKKTVSYEAKFALQNFNASVRLRSSLTFHVQKEDSSEVVKKDIAFSIPIYALIINTPIDQASFINLLKTELQAMHTGSINVSVSRAVRKLTSTFNMTVLEEKPERASMYGRLVSGAHVAILLKEEGGKDQLAVAAKAKEPALSESLIREVVYLFRK